MKKLCKNSILKPVYLPSYLNSLILSATFQTSIYKFKFITREWKCLKNLRLVWKYRPPYVVWKFLHLHESSIPWLGLSIVPLQNEKWMTEQRNEQFLFPPKKGQNGQKMVNDVLPKNEDLHCWKSLLRVSKSEKLRPENYGKWDPLSQRIYQSNDRL